MEVDFQLIFRRLEPYQAVSALGALREQDGRIFADYPGHPEWPLQLEGRELVSTTAECPFLAGTLFDYLALHHGQDYVQVVAYVLQHYAHLAENPLGLSLRSLQPQFAQQLALARSRFLGLTGLRFHLLEDDARLIPARLWLRQRELQPEAVWRLLYAAEGEELNTLLADDRFTAGHCHLVFPFFANFHTVSGLVIQDLETRSEEKVELVPCQHDYFGLHSLTPGQTALVGVTVDEALAIRQRLQDAAQHQAGVLQVRLEPDAPSNEFRWEHGCLLAKADPDFSQVARLRGAFRRFAVSPGGLVDAAGALTNGRPWTDYVRITFQTLLRGDTCSPAMVSLMENLKADPEARQFLLDCLAASGRTKLLARLRQHLDTRQSYVINSMRVVETENGYIARKGGTGTETLFTNFLLKVDRNIWFEPDELYYVGRVLMAGREYPFHISRTGLRKPDVVLKAATTAVRGCTENQAVPNPTVFDTTLQGRLADVLAQQAAQQITMPGVRRLGWNPAMSLFTTPLWRTSLTGLEQTARVLYPGSSFFKDYFTTPVHGYPTTDAEDLIRSSGRMLLAVLAALLGRAALRLPCPLVRVQRSENTLRAAQAMCLALGQQKPVVLNPNRRRDQVPFEQELLSGYPILATTVNESQLETLQQPMLLLADSGLSCWDPVEDAARTQIYSLALRLLPALTLQLMRQPEASQAFFPTQEATPVTLIAEGRQFIEHCLQRTFPIFEPGLQNLYQALAEIPFSEVPRYFRFSLETQTLTMDCRNIQVVKRKDIYLDLQTLGLQPRLDSSGHCVTADSAGFLDLLERFYGSPVRLFPPASPPAAPVPAAALRLVTA
jgi:hypothetical protein